MSGTSETIRKRQAKSGRVATSTPSILHETSKSRITLVPYYIPHSTKPDELSVKLIRYKKLKDGAFPQTVEDGSINLNGPAALKLMTSLRHNLEVANQEDGAYIVLKVDDGTADIGGNDPGAIAAALTTLLSREDIVSHLHGLDLSEELIDSLA